jgi:triacylglycerol lipase
MIARLQKTTTFLLLLVAAFWGFSFARAGRPALAAAGILIVLFGYALFLAGEFVLLRCAGQEIDTEAPPWREMLGAWLGEVARTPAVFCWRQPFRSQAEPDSLLSDHRGRIGVVFVHGFLCNRGFWNPWMQKLRARGVPFVAISLEPPFTSIDRYAPAVGAAFARIEAVTGCAPMIVAHSMGGLAVRAWLALRRDATRPHHVVTIASPHHGTWLARWFHAPNGVQMRRESEWLKSLAAAESVDDRERLTCFYGRCDNIVFPISSATLSGADNRHLQATAHVQMAFHPEVFAEVLRRLEESPSKLPAVDAATGLSARA